MVIRRELEGAECDVELLVDAYESLELGLVDAALWPNHAQTLLFLPLLWNCLLNGSVVLLVTRQDVGYQGALAWQKATRDF